MGTGGGGSSVKRRVASSEILTRFADAFGYARIDPRAVRRQAPARGPVPQAFDGLTGGHGHRHDVRGRLDERHVEQAREPAAGPDLGPGEIPVAGPSLRGIQRELLQVQPPDELLLSRPRKVEEEDRVEALSPRKLWRQFRNVI